jgi:hypothetical protein
MKAKLALEEVPYHISRLLFPKGLALPPEKKATSYIL